MSYVRKEVVLGSMKGQGPKEAQADSDSSEDFERSNPKSLQNDPKRSNKYMLLRHLWRELC